MDDQPQSTQPATQQTPAQPATDQKTDQSSAQQSSAGQPLEEQATDQKPEAQSSEQSTEQSTDKKSPAQSDTDAKQPAQPTAGSSSTTPTNQTKQIGRYQVEVTREKCIGAASCVAIAPKVFELDEEEIAKVISQDGNDDDTKLLAAQSCPTMAIIITDTEVGQQVWPPAGST